MKELTIEEKAKAYDKAIEKLRNAFYGNNSRMCEEYRQAVIRIIEPIFPELKKPEDEEIRKALIENFKFCGGDFLEKAKWGKDDDLLVTDILAWLEKQGEQKPAFEMKSAEESLGIDSETYNKIVDECIYGDDEQKPVNKVEPKFKAGNWYQCTKDFFGKGVTFDKNNAYYCAQEGCLQNEYGCHIAIVKDLYDNFKLWAIQDAKAGDVLEFGDHGRLVVGIVSHVNKTTGKVDVSCLLEDDKFKVGVFYNLDTVKPHPATKEQHDSLFAAMKEAGYDLDAEKKELKKISQRIISAEAKEVMYGKPTAWSENDEYIIERLSYLLDNEQENYPQLSCDFQEIQEFKDWLKSLKQRIKL